jgi:hypothetical protein
MIGTPDNVEFQAVSIARPQLAVTDVLFAGGIKIPAESRNERENCHQADKVFRF